MHPLHLRYFHWTILESISDEFEASEAICCDKRHEWLKNNAYLIWKIIFIHPKPIYIIFATSHLPRALYKGRHCNVPHEYTQVTS
jgi:hypothetical protein